MHPRRTGGASMSSLVQTAPAFLTRASFHRFSVDAYHRLMATGILEENTNIELLEGYLVLKMSKHPPHVSSLQRTRKRLTRLLPSGWDERIQDPVTLID